MAHNPEEDEPIGEYIDKDGKDVANAPSNTSRKDSLLLLAQIEKKLPERRGTSKFLAKDEYLLNCGYNQALKEIKATLEQIRVKL